MITFSVTDKSISDIKSSCYAFVFEEGEAYSKDFKEFSAQFQPDLLQALKESEFTGKALQTRILPGFINKQWVYPIFVGLGKKKDRAPLDIEVYRRALGIIYKKVIAHKKESFVFCLPSPSLFGVTMEYLAQNTALIFNMAAYHFDDYITDKDRKETKVYDITISVDAKHKKAVQDAIKEGECIALAVNKTRHWVDLPPMICYPNYFADKAKEIAKKSGLTVTVFNENQINEMGMGGLAGVARGSELDCSLVILEYKTKKKGAPTIAFVGKGITFDSGGLSLKPASAMETMKEDMAGAAAVIATLEALAVLKPDVNVVGLAPIAENLPSGTATKPGDILRFYNGKTAEVKNTDAEGRLILADALSYAVKHYNLDAIIDIATLTGACAHALGPFFTGLMSQDPELTEKIIKAAKISGDRVWPLPMDDDYKPAIRSDVADISNIGSQKYRAGAITAAFFLQHFVNNVPWAHLDIAGTAFDVPDISYYRSGATGAGVRLLIALAMAWNKNK
jgi:leucyl aminopeptidase